MLHLKTCTGCTDLPARYPLYRKINSFRLSITAYPLPPGSRRKGDGGRGGEKNTKRNSLPPFLSIPLLFRRLSCRLLTLSSKHLCSFFFVYIISVNFNHRMLIWIVKKALFYGYFWKKKRHY